MRPLKGMARAALLTASVLTPFTLGAAGAQSLPKETRERIIQATVMLLPTDQNGDLDGSRGSGSIISPQGFILTNYHVVGDPDTRQLSPWIQVRVVQFADREPVFTYWGRVVAADPNLDLAIVQIVEDRNEKPVGKLNLPFVEVGDSNTLSIGDDVFVFGFQGTGGMTLSFSRGSVGGFTGEDLSSSGRQWVKHDAQTGPGNSGGGVFDESGVLVGVHSAGVAGNNNSRTSFMRPLALAWGLITPNVTGFVVRRGGSGGSGGGSGNGGSGGGTGTSGTGNGGSGSGGSGGTPAGAWPPALAAGQTWTVNFAQGGTYSVKLGTRDSEGDYPGTATQGGSTTETLFTLDGGSLLMIVGRGDGTFLTCSVDRTQRGAARTYQNSKDPGVAAGTCTLASAGAGSAATLRWPLALKVGQRWDVAFPGVGTFTVSLDEPDEDGFAGSATRGSEKGSVLFSADADGLLLIVQRADKTFLVCSAAKGGLGAGSVKGDATRHRDSKDQGTSLGACTVTPR